MSKMPTGLKILLGFLIIGIGLCIILAGYYGDQREIKSEQAFIEREKALWEKCILETELKFPDSPNSTINRLCELEKMGRNLN